MQFVQPNTTFLALLTVLLGAFAVASDDHKSGVVDDIIDDLISAKRTVLVVCKFSNRFVLVVSGPGGTLDLENGVVFDQKASTMDGNKVYLDEPEKLKDKWPSLVGQEGAKFIVIGSKNYIITVDNDINKNNFSVFNMDDGTISQMLFMPSSVEIIHNYNQRMSSSEVFTVYTFGMGPGLVAKFKFSNTNLTQSVGLHGQLPVYFFCTTDKGMIVNKKSKCSQPVDWTIQAGYVDDSMFLFFEKDNSVNFFPKSVFDSFDTPVYLTQISAKDFWKSSDSKSSKAVLIVIIVVAVIAILALAIAGYFLCCRKRFKVQVSIKKRRTSSKRLRKRSSRRSSKKHPAKNHTNRHAAKHS